MANFLRFLLFCQSHCPKNLSGYLKDLIYQKVLVEVLCRDHDKMELAYVVVWGLFVVECIQDLSDDVETMVRAKFEIAHDFVIGY